MTVLDTVQFETLASWRFTDCQVRETFYLAHGGVVGNKSVTVAAVKPIHVTPVSILRLGVSTDLFETGIKVIDLITPYKKGGKIGLFGGAGVGKTVVIMAHHNTHFKAYLRVYYSSSKYYFAGNIRTMIFGIVTVHACMRFQAAVVPVCSSINQH